MAHDSTTDPAPSWSQSVHPCPHWQSPLPCFITLPTLSSPTPCSRHIWFGRYPSNCWHQQDSSPFPPPILAFILWQNTFTVFMQQHAPTLQWFSWTGPQFPCLIQTLKARCFKHLQRHRRTFRTCMQLIQHSFALKLWQNSSTSALILGVFSITRISNWDLGNRRLLTISTGLKWDYIIIESCLVHKPQVGISLQPIEPCQLFKALMSSSRSVGDRTVCML